LTRIADAQRVRRWLESVDSTVMRADTASTLGG